MRAELRPLEQLRQLLGRARPDVQLRKDSREVLERRLGGMTAVAMARERTLHPGVCRDDGAARIRLVLQVLDRVGHRSGEVRPDARVAAGQLREGRRAASYVVESAAQDQQPEQGESECAVEMGATCRMPQAGRQL